MKLIITETNTIANIVEEKVTILEVYPTNLPNGITDSVLTAAGQLISSSAAATPAVVTAPASSGLVLQSDTNEVTKMKWIALNNANLTAENSQTDSYTTTADDNNKIIIMDKATSNTLTIHSTAQAGFSVLVYQKGAGQTTIAAGGTGALLNFDSHTKLAGQKAAASVLVISNAGTAPQCLLQGRTA